MHAGGNGLWHVLPMWVKPWGWLICLSLQQLSDALPSFAISSAIRIMSVAILGAILLFRWHTWEATFARPVQTVAAGEDSTV